MEVSLAVNEGLERQLSISIPEEEMSAKMANRFDQLARTARINGFRPGKVPMRVVKQRFGDQVRQEVIGEVLQSSLTEALRQESLQPAGEPTIDPLSAEPGEGLTYTATFEVMPEVTVAPLDSLTITRPETEVTDADVDEMVESLRKQHTEFQPVERASQLEDGMTLDFTGTIEGEAFEGGSGEGVKVVLGQGQFIEGFEDNLVGMQTGNSKQIDLTFPEDYRNEALAGKPVTFNVSVTEVAEPVLPELNEAFFQRFNMDVSDVEGFRAEVKRNMERERDGAVTSLTKRQVMDALLAATEVVLPKAMVEREQRRLLMELQQMLTSRGGDAKQLSQIQPELFAERAAERVKLGFIITELTKQANLEADPAKVRAEVEKLAATYEQPEDVVQWYYAERSRLADVEALCAENALVDWICEQAKVETETLGFQDLMTKNQKQQQES